MNYVEMQFIESQLNALTPFKTTFFGGNANEFKVTMTKTTNKEQNFGFNSSSFYNNPPDDYQISKKGKLEQIKKLTTNLTSCLIVIKQIAFKSGKS